MVNMLPRLAEKVVDELLAGISSRPATGRREHDVAVTSAREKNIQ